MTGAFATRIFRIVFILAGFYNLAFGLWAALWPVQFFQLFQITPPRYPQIWGCLGMVVGVYGLLYWYAAWKPQLARPIIAIGLLGKVLGPIGMALNISNEWPRRLAMLNVYNDVIWWVPFALFLLRDNTAIKKLVRYTPEFCAGIHLLGLTLWPWFFDREWRRNPLHFNARCTSRSMQRSGRSPGASGCSARSVW